MIFCYCFVFFFWQDRALKAAAPLFSFSACGSVLLTFAFICEARVELTRNVRMIGKRFAMVTFPLSFSWSFLCPFRLRDRFYPSAAAFPPPPLDNPGANAVFGCRLDMARFGFFSFFIVFLCIVHASARASPHTPTRVCPRFIFEAADDGLFAHRRPSVAPCCPFPYVDSTGFTDFFLSYLMFFVFFLAQLSPSLAPPCLFSAGSPKAVLLGVLFFSFLTFRAQTSCRLAHPPAVH